MRCSALLAAMVVIACSKSGDETSTPDTSNIIITPADSSVPAPGQRLDTPRASLDCGVPGAPVLADEGIGELRHGRTVAEIKARCDVLSDTEQRGVEGMMERALIVRLAGETVRAVIADDRVFRIEINSPRFRTPDSLGVDTPLRKIAAMRGAQFAPGENGVYGFSPDHCGLSFRFSLPWRPPAGGQWTAAQIMKEHGDAAVDRVIVIQCSR